MSLNHDRPDAYVPLRPLPQRGTIGIFAPSTPAEAEKIEQGIRYLESLGYRTLTTPSCSMRDEYLAGSGKARARDLMNLVNDPLVDAVFCTRGGFGCLMMLPYLDYDAIKSARKLILGFSDVTALHWGIYSQCGLPAISAGMVATDLSYPQRNPQFETYFWKLLETGETEIAFENELWDHSRPPAQLSGVLMPGTMSVAAMLLGTRWFPRLKGCIPVLEDVDEPRHKVEAYLTQLCMGGHFSGCEALLFGQFTDAAVQGYPEVPALDKIIRRATAGLSLQLAKGLDYGHVPGKISLPLGVPISVSWGPTTILRTRQSIFES